MESKSKHTPGSWRPVTDGITHWVEIDGIIVMVMNCRTKQAQDNARLIAAAPDLLEALVSILEHPREFDGLEDYETMVSRIQEKARAAIAKAEEVKP